MLLRTVIAVTPAPGAATRVDPYVDAGELLKALSAPVRIAIVTQLHTSGPACVHELVDALQVAQPLVSQHLRILRSASIVEGRRRGREVVYALADEHVAHIVADAVAHVQEDRHVHDQRHNQEGR